MYKVYQVQQCNMLNLRRRNGAHCNIYRRGMTIDSMQCKMKCTEGWPMKVNIIGIYQRERDQCNIQNYKFEKQILQIQLNAEHNSFRVWFERHQCIPTELKRQTLVKICNTGLWWHLLCNFSELENQELARWHFEKVQKAEEDVEKIVIQSSPWKEEQAVADQCFETLKECNKAEKSAYRLQCLHNMTHPMLTRWHWYFNIYSSPSLSIRKCFLMFGYNLWLKCLKGGGYFYMYMDRVGAWYSILK